MVMAWPFKCMSPCLVRDFFLKICQCFIFQARGNTGGARSLGGDNIMLFITVKWSRNWFGLRWPSHLIQHFGMHFEILLKLSIMSTQLFSEWCFQMFLDVLGVLRMLLFAQRCVQDHTWYLSRAPRAYPCKFFLPGVNCYRFNAKNWRFSV